MAQRLSEIYIVIYATIIITSSVHFTSVMAYSRGHDSQSTYCAYCFAGSEHISKSSILLAPSNLQYKV